jgi:hypothetical protein
MADEDTVLEEAMDNLKEAGQRIRATHSLMCSQGMTDGENHRDLLTRLSTALTMTEAAYLEVRRRRDLYPAKECILARTPVNKGKDRAGALDPSPVLLLGVHRT